MKVFRQWSRVPTGLYTKTQLAKLGYELNCDAHPTAHFHGRNTYDLYELSQAIAKKKHKPPVCVTSLDIGIAIKDLSRHAHRARHPGQAKVRFAAKTAALLKLIDNGEATVTSKQYVNGRLCACIEYDSHEYHLPYDILSDELESELHDICEKEPMAVFHWPKPSYSLNQIRCALAEIGVETQAIRVRCSSCDEFWRYDVKGSKAVRTCPQCYQEYQDYQAEEADANDYIDGDEYD